MTTDDLAMVHGWRNHPDVRRNMYTHHEISEPEHLAWWAGRDIITRRYLIAEDGASVGFVGFSKLDLDQKTADWAFYKNPDAPKGVGKAMELAALEYAFDVLGLRKLSCEVLSFNKPVYYLHRKHGFQIEGLFKKAHAFEGAYYDIYRLSLFQSDYVTPTPRKIIGEELAVKVTITDSMIETFAALSGDYNDVHSGPKKIAHGLLTAAFFSSLLGQHSGALYLSQTLKFLKPVHPQDEILVAAKAISQIGDRVWFETTARRGEDIVLDGEALILLKSES